MLKIIRISDLKWEGKLENEVICEFEYYRDAKGRIWVNNIGCRNQRKGYGTQMIKAAIEAYEAIYFSTATKKEIKEKNLSEDGRYSNDGDLKIFQTKLLEKGVILRGWIRHPFCE
jgi:hypothetical protein